MDDLMFFKYVVKMNICSLSIINIHTPLMYVKSQFNLALLLNS